MVGSIHASAKADGVQRTAAASESPATPAADAAHAILTVEGLRTYFPTRRGPIKAVDNVSLRIGEGETLAVVGESGSGKSVTSLSIMRLVGLAGGSIVDGAMMFRRRNGKVVNLAGLSESEMRAVRGNEIAMIFQEPMTSLDPVHSVGNQIAEAVRLHQRVGRREAFARAVQMLDYVGISSPQSRAHEYPHQMSGGMRQRVMIAMALSCRPSLLIADEPTTALDVTIQAQILELIRRLQTEQAMSVLFITHNLGVVADVADRVAVMYAGRVVEEAAVTPIFKAPRHPYTIGLLGSIPQAERGAGAQGQGKRRLEAIPGSAPPPLERPAGCAFAPRCSLAVDACRSAEPPLVDTGAGHKSACIRWQDLGQ
jgi:oligopeptide/dipeptide ABC transporter ATP-binding protein